jgi:hypothetical protein
MIASGTQMARGVVMVVWTGLALVSGSLVTSSREAFWETQMMGITMV